MKAQKFETLETYIIRIEPGEPLMASLEKFARDKQIGFASVEVIGGGFKEIEYAFSVGHDTGYVIKKEVGGERGFELLKASGCIAWDDDNIANPAVHLHATFSDDKLEKSFGGHLIEVKKVDLTAEVKVTVLSWEKITRKLVPEVNVKLLNLPDYSSVINQNQTNQQGNKGEVERLREENRRLRNQNTELSRQVANLNGRLVAQVSASPKNDG